MATIYTEEWARENTFPKAQCVEQYKQHGFTETDLIADLGDKSTYPGADVLNALGY